MNIVSGDKMTENEKLLFTACSNGDIEKVRSLLRKKYIFFGKKVDVNIRDPWGSYKGYTPLLVAIERCNLKIVKLLIKHGANMNVAIEGGIREGESALHTAVYHNMNEALEFMLKRGAMIEVRNRVGETLLHRCYQDYRNVEEMIATAKILLKHGLNINERSNRGENTLSTIKNGSYIEFAAFLISSGADVNSRSDDGDTPLHICDSEIAELLIENGANVHAKNASGDTPLMNGWSKYDTCDILINNGAAVNEKNNEGNTALHIMSSWKGCFNRQKFELLLQHGADVNAQNGKGNTPLHLAVLEPCLSAVEFLLNYGANIEIENDYKESALVTAARQYVKYCDYTIKYKTSHEVYSEHMKNIIDVMVMIMRQGRVANNNIFGEVLINYARFFGTISEYAKSDFIELLIKQGANPNARDEQGNSALHISATRYMDCAKLLIEHGADIDVTNRDGFTPLHLSVDNNRSDLANTLLFCGANINVKNCQGNTPLHLAVTKKYVDLVEILLRSNADVNIKNYAEETPIYDAIRGNCVDVVRLLLEKGAYTDNENVACSPLYLATQSNFSDLVKLLLEYGAHTNVNWSGGTPLHVAVTQNSTEVAKLFITSNVGIDVTNNEDVSPLQMAIQKGNVSMTDLLLSHGAALYEDCNFIMKAVRNKGIAEAIEKYKGKNFILEHRNEYVRININRLHDNNGKYFFEAVECLASVGDIHAIEPLFIHRLRDFNPEHLWTDNKSEKDLLFQLRYSFGSDDFSSKVNFYYNHLLQCLHYTNYYNHSSAFGGSITYKIGRAEKSALALSQHNNPITTNLLHLIAKIKDTFVPHFFCLSESEVFNDFDEGKSLLSFSSVRQIATDELQKRGNPRYDSEAFLDENAY
jgi:ankyrin repeat protein